jgi:sulfhydrogenase subunit beta (sulfur reductase)
MSTKIGSQTQEKSIIVQRNSFDALFAALKSRGFTVVGPTFRHGVIVLDTITGSQDLPAGWGDEQSGGTYRTKQRKDAALFGFNSGAHSWKKYVHPPVLRLLKAKRNGRAFLLDDVAPPPQKLAFVGVRSCDLHALGILDKVMERPPYPDPGYHARRANTFIVAVNCTEAGGTCFCASVGAGPKADAGFDIALTEVVTKNEHYFVAVAGTTRGADVLKEVPHEVAAEPKLAAADKAVAGAAAKMGRSVDTKNIDTILEQNTENSRWSEVARRCLTCTNCTMVCPTCFCTTVEDVTDLAGSSAERWRKWDSCFTLDFSYIHGGSVRTSGMSRYRQWLTHKFSSWTRQFGSLGCVGCGRCITWCPVGIDITEELSAIRENDVTITNSSKEKS